MRILRFLPIALLVVIAGPLLTVANPGLFWDDWVWFFQEPQENIQIGKELGIWWAGYLSNAIYALDHPTLTLRITSLVAWALAAAAAGFAFYRRRWLTGIEAFTLFLLIAACHVSMVRFLNSVALYNVYIASFWIGAAVLSINSRSWPMRLLSLPFFFFSFHLNSLLFLYGLVLLMLLGELAPWGEWLEPLSSGRWKRWLQPWKTGAWKRAVKLWKARKWQELLEPLSYGRLMQRLDAILVPDNGLSRMARAMWPVVLRFIRKDWIFILLPLGFVLMIRLMKVKSDLYLKYNSLSTSDFFHAIPVTFSKLWPTFELYNKIMWRHTSLKYLAYFAIPYLLLLLLLPRIKKAPGWPAVIKTALLGIVLLYIGMFPYIATGKPPLLRDYYDSRHILTAVPGIALFQLAILMALTKPLFPRFLRYHRMLRTVVLAVILGLASNYSFLSGIDLLKDWIRQEAIGAYVRKNLEALEPYRTFIFIDETEGFRIGYRKIWNYEYTGELIKVYATEERLGISLKEYINWPNNVALIRDKALRKRYNLKDYQFRTPHIILTMRNTRKKLKLKNALKILRAYWKKQPIDDMVLEYIEFIPSLEYREADRHMRNMKRIFAAIERYKNVNGYYPINAISTTPVKTRLGVLSAQTFSAPSRRDEDAWKKALAPRYISEYMLTAQCKSEECGYIYISDGIDFKLVFNNPHDLPYARQAYGDHIDPRRNAYGYWSKGAEKW